MAFQCEKAYDNITLTSVLLVQLPNTNISKALIEVVKAQVKPFT